MERDTLYIFTLAHVLIRKTGIHFARDMRLRGFRPD